MNKVGLVSLMFLCTMGNDFIWSEKGSHRKERCRGFKIQDKAWGEKIAPHTVMGVLHFGSDSVGLWEAIMYF